jgi:hypothetical protein
MKLASKYPGIYLYCYTIYSLLYYFQILLVSYNIYIIGALRSACFLSEAQDPEGGGGPRLYSQKSSLIVSFI